MDTAITLRDAGLIAIGIGLIILLFYCINLIRNLIPVVKSLRKVLEDTDRIIVSAADSVDGAQKILSEVTESVSMVSDALKGNQNIIQAASSIVNFVGALKRFFKKP